jgi:hypothetical protein
VRSRMHLPNAHQVKNHQAEEVNNSFVLLLT